MIRWDVRLQLHDSEPTRVIEAEELLIDDDRRAAIFFTNGDVVAVIALQAGITITKSEA